MLAHENYPPWINSFIPSWTIASTMKCGMKLLIQLKIVNGWLILSHTLVGMLLLIHVIKVTPCYHPWRWLKHLQTSKTQDFAHINTVILYEHHVTTGQESDSLKRKRHFKNMFIAGCSEKYHFDNSRCSQSWKFRQNDNISVDSALALICSVLP